MTNSWNPDTERGRRGHRRRSGSPLSSPTRMTSGGPEREQRRAARDEGPERPRHPRPGGRGPSGRDGRRRGGRRRDVRGAVLLVLTEAPMHGYQVMQAIAERSEGRWRPSPGAVYPVLQAMEDEGLLTVDAEGGRKVAHLTDEGRAAAEALAAQGPDPFTSPGGDAAGPDLREAVGALGQAAREVDRHGTPAQRARAHEVLAEARRQLYGLLAERPTD